MRYFVAERAPVPRIHSENVGIVGGIQQPVMLFQITDTYSFGSEKFGTFGIKLSVDETLRNLYVDLHESTRDSEARNSPAVLLKSTVFPSRQWFRK